MLAGAMHTSAFAAGYATLKLGDTGSEVKSMQAALAALGYLSGSADGKFGAKTQAAVKSFQKGNRLTSDGKAGNLTLTALYNLSGGGTTTNSGTTGSSSGTSTGTASTSGKLVYGNSGSEVKKLQTALTNLGYSTGGADGKFGKATLNAVKAFQKASKLTADGIAGAKTLQVLYATGTADTGSSSDASGGSSTTYTTLRQGATGDAVKALQTRLAVLNYSAEATGTYDSKTTAAVKSFQSRNKLTADGVAGAKTQTALYADSAVKYSAQSAGYDVPSIGTIKLLHWFNDVKPALRGKSSIYVYDPASKYSYTLHLYSLGNHADVEPQTADDTANMMAAFGGKATWTPKFVYVRLPNGVWTVATMHNVAHGGQSIKDNNFEGQNCVHFLRDMAEVSKNDPDYGVVNQNALRKGWQQLTGEVVN